MSIATTTAPTRSRPRRLAPTACRPAAVAAAAAEPVAARADQAGDGDVNIYYGAKRAVRDVDLDVPANAVTAFIGPSGCGKSTILRCFNRMNDLIPGASVEGKVTARRRGHQCARTSSRSRSGAGSAWSSSGPTRSRCRSTTTSPTARAGTAIKDRAGSTRSSSARLRRAALWDEVKDDYRRSRGSRCPAASSSACASRGRWRPSPRSILMDEPCSALDPIATLKIEELMAELREQLHDRDRDPQHAAGVARQRPDRVLHDGRGPAGLPRRDGQHGQDLHQPEGAADRGLRLGPVRLSEREDDDDDRSGATSATADADRPTRSSEILIGTRRTRRRAADAAPGRESASIARSARSRTTCCGWAAWSRRPIRAAIEALVDHDADAATGR